jgi:hypothetical protein
MGLGPPQPTEERMTRRERRRPDSDERRTHRRIPAASLPELSAHLSGGSKVTLLDLSLHGVRLETTRHMRPGQVVSVRFSVNGQLITINASVVRASIVRVEAEEVRYETGLRLSDGFSCEQLQVALVERRVVDGCYDEIECPEEFVFTNLDDASGKADPSHGWWLAAPRKGRPQVLEG